MSQKPVSFPLNGGLDLVSAAVATPPGRCIDSDNYEPVATGYRRLRGYERFSGKLAPSEATHYYRIDFTGGGFGTPDQPIAGQTLYKNGATSNRFVVGSVTVTSGSWATSDAVGYFIAAHVVGTPTGDMKDALSGGFITCTVTTITTDYDFGSSTLNAAALATAVAGARSSIFAVGGSLTSPTTTGSGAVRGIWGFNGEIFAFRDNAAGTGGNMWKATTDGWSLITLKVSIPFTVDTATQTMPVAGDLISNSSGGASKGTISTVKITNTTGTVSTGYLTITTASYVAGAFTAAGQTIWKATTATQLGTTTGVPSNLTFSAAGRYFFINHNFYGADDQAAMFGVNGVNQAFRWDGASCTGIATGMTTDTPTRIAEHKNALLLAFPGGSLQTSTVGEPMTFNPITGTTEIGIGSDVTDLISMPGGTTAILAEQKIGVLYGFDSSDYQLETLTDEAGALPYTAQRFGQVIYMDNRGLRSLAAAQRFGNFTVGTISRLVSPLIEKKRRDGVDPTASLVIRTADQYWVFFDDSTALVAYLGGKEPSIMSVSMGGILVSCAASIELDGVERAFVGTSQGYVMELNKGTTFDGASVVAYVRLPFNPFGAPRNVKRVHRIVVDLELPSGSTNLQVQLDFDGGEVSGDTVESEVTTGGSYLGQVEGSAEAYYDGIFKNASLKIGTNLLSSSLIQQAHTITQATFFMSARGIDR